jgi:CMP-2-keto-3-deoxyoctulosonic acid synthetase
MGDCIIEIGKMLSNKAKGRPSSHFVTKEVREAMEWVRRNPTGNPEEAIKIAISQDTPFINPEKVEHYKRILKQLLERFVNACAEMNTQQCRKLMNMILEGVYNNASYFSRLSGEESEKEGNS